MNYELWIINYLVLRTAPWAYFDLAQHMLRYAPTIPINTLITFFNDKQSCGRELLTYRWRTMVNA